MDTANPWGVALFRTLKATNPRSVVEQSAYDKWLDHTADREEARSDRIHGAVGVIPGSLWVVLFFITAVIFVFMLFFADSAERAVVQAMMVGSVIAVIAATLLLIRFLDDPFRDGFGGLNRWRWSGRSASWTRSAASSGTPAPCRATREADPLGLGLGHLNEAFADGPEGGLGARAEAELAEDVRHVRPGRPLADPSSAAISLFALPAPTSRRTSSSRAVSSSVRSDVERAQRRHQAPRDGGIELELAAVSGADGAATSSASASLRR